MIGRLRGTLLEKRGSEVLIDVGGVGYRCSIVPGSTWAREAAEVVAHIHHHVREDAQVLYAFPTRDERDSFEILIGTHGVGPTLALSILSTLSPDDLVEAVLTDDLAALCLVPGVGRKTAARLLLELRSRFGERIDGSTPSERGVTPPREGDAPPDPRSDARSALIALGYGSDEVIGALRGLPDGDAAVLVREGLKRLAARSGAAGVG